MIAVKLDERTVETLRASAASIVDDVLAYVSRHTTDSVERATARLLGIDGVGPGGLPRPNVLVDHLRPVLGDGVARYVASGVARGGCSPNELCDRIEAGGLDLSRLEPASESQVRAVADRLLESGLGRIRQSNARRADWIGADPPRDGPLLYVIVASGNIYDDAVQAASAARAGAHAVSIIRSTAQSLLDYVPEGSTTEGFGGTYATQENFRIVRAALDDVSRELGRYVRLVNYASGLCMPEIAVLGAFERLDMMVNDCMYGILFRDINMRRTFIDQHFSRAISALSDMVIHTGEDNYLRTSDAIDRAHTVVTSNFINEQFALRAGLRRDQIGIGHAYEIVPEIENSLLYELAHGLLIATLFRDSPTKFMPPTRHMDGDIFRTCTVNAVYNLVSSLSGQRIHFPGMLTEGFCTPFLHDRALALRSTRMVMNAARDFGENLVLREDGFVRRRMDEVLRETRSCLAYIEKSGLMRAIEEGVFANVRRSETSGRGGEGVHRKSETYFNPVYGAFREGLETRAWH